MGRAHRVTARRIVGDQPREVLEVLRASMRKIGSLLVLACVLSLVASCSGGGGGDTPPPGTCVDFSGTWSTIEEIDTTPCPGGEVFTRHRTYTVTQEGCSFTISFGTLSWPGTIDGDQILYTATYEQPDSTATETAHITIAGDSLDGSSDWTWTDGVDTCSFTAGISGTRVDEPPPPGECVDFAGTWSTVQYEDGTDCGEGFYTFYEEYTVMQNGCDFTIATDTGTYTGTVVGDRVSWTGSFPEEGGTTTATINLTITGDSISGSRNWTWADDYSAYTCSGTTDITGTRL